MSSSTRFTAHLVVVGLALIVLAVRPAEAASSWSFAAGNGPAFSGQTVTPAPEPAGHARPRHHRPAHRREVAHRRQPVHRADHRAVPAPRQSARPSTRTATAVQKVHVTVRRTSGPTGWAQLDSAIARIPSYHAHAARWVVSSRYGHWGTADWYHDTLYIEPSVPSAYLYDVAVHEWSHELSVLDYNGNVAAAVAAMNRYFGGSGLVGAERAADCMAILQGATWTHYTTCTDQRWRAGAALLLRRQPL
jgi:hypothetical protein